MNQYDVVRAVMTWDLGTNGMDKAEAMFQRCSRSYLAEKALLAHKSTARFFASLDDANQERLVDIAIAWYEEANRG